VAEGRALCEELLELGRRRGEHVSVPYMLIIRGQLAADPDVAAAAFREALELAPLRCPLARAARRDRARPAVGEHRTRRRGERARRDRARRHGRRRRHARSARRARARHGMNKKNPSKKYSSPNTPVALPKYQNARRFVSAEIDDSRIAIWRNIAASPNAAD